MPLTGFPAPGVEQPEHTDYRRVGCESPAAVRGGQFAAVPGPGPPTVVGSRWKSVIGCSRFDISRNWRLGTGSPHLLASRSTSFAVCSASSDGGCMARSSCPVAACWAACRGNAARLSSAWRGVTAMPEPPRRVVGGHVGGSGVQRGSQTLNGSRRHGSQGGLDLRPAGLDGREVGGIAGQVAHCQPCRRDGVLDRLVLVGREVVHDQCPPSGRSCGRRQTISIPCQVKDRVVVLRRRWRCRGPGPRNFRPSPLRSALISRKSCRGGNRRSCRGLRRWRRRRSVASGVALQVIVAAATGDVVVAVAAVEEIVAGAAG